MKNQLLITDVNPARKAEAALIALACAGLNADSDHWRDAARQKLRADFPADRYIIHVGGMHVAVHERRTCPQTSQPYAVEWESYGALVARVLEVPVDPRSRSTRYELSRGAIPVADFANTLTTLTWALVPVGFWGGKAA